MELKNVEWLDQAVVWTEPWLAGLREQSLGQLTVRCLGVAAAFYLLWWAARRFAALQWVDEARRSLRGYWGELKVRWALKLWFKGSHQWHNVFVACPNGLTQVDHVLVTGRGVFVLETKNFRNAEQREESKGSKSWIQQAMDQNQWHCAAIADRLDVPEEEIRNVVVMAGRASRGLVWSGVRRGLVSTLWHLWSKYPKYFQKRKVEEVVEKLSRHLHPSTPLTVEAHRSQGEHGRFPKEVLLRWGYDLAEIAGVPPLENAIEGQSVDAPSGSSVTDEAERLAAEAERSMEQQLELLSFLREHRAHAYSQEYGKFRWSVAEEAVCRNLLKAGVSLSEVARASGRSPSAVSTRLESLRASHQESPVNSLGPAPAL